MAGGGAGCCHCDGRLVPENGQQPAVGTPSLPASQTATGTPTKLPEVEALCWRRSPLFSIPRFDFCLTPRSEPVTLVKSQSALGFCGRPLCSGQDYEMELSVVR